MIRTSQRLAILAAFCATSASFGQALTINQPKRGDDESANATSGIMGGDSTIVSLNIPGGLDASGEVTNGELIQIRATVLDSTGTLVGIATPNPVTTTDTYTDVAIDISIDLSAFDFTGLLAPGNVIQLEATSITSNGMGMSLAAVFDAVDESVDETLVLDTTPPTMLEFLITPTQAFARFNEPIDSDGDAVGPPNENVNDTDTANLDETDFQRAMAPGFTGAEASPTNTLTPVGFVGSQDNVLEFNLTVGDLAVGDFIRLNHDGAPGNAMHDLFDIVGNVGDATEVQVTMLPGLDAVSAELLTAVAAGATEVGALRVTFNDEIADPGDAGDYTLLLDGMASTFTLANPTLDPSDSSNTVVLLDVTAPGGDSIESDARTGSSDGAATGAFTLRVLADGMAAELTDIFGQSISTADDVSVADVIEPNLASTGFGDTNPTDGRQDTVYFVFDEPMSLPGATTGATISVIDAVTVTPFDLIDAQGNLVTGQTTAGASNSDLTIASVVLASLDLDVDGTISARETNNAICYQFDATMVDWDDDGNVGPIADADEPIPGTGDASVLEIDYTVSTSEIQDASANDFTNGGGGDITDSPTVDDYALPLLALAAILDGDNTNPDETAVISDNDQIFIEQFVGGMPANSDLGRELESRRAVLSFSEDLAALTNAILEEQVSIGGAFLVPATDDMGTFGFAVNNQLTLRNLGGNDDFDVGQPVQINAQSGIIDGSAQMNEALDSGTLSDLRAPYLMLQAALDSADPPVHGAFLIDSNGDGFANQINLQMSQPIDASTLDTSDFTPAFGTVTGVALDTNPTVIVISLADGVVSALNPLGVTYNGSTDMSLIASDSAQGGTGFAVSAVDATFDASPIPQAPPTDNVAIMDIIGTATQGGTPLPAGTRIVAMVATPVVTSITAEHNNNTFTTSDTLSVTAFTNWLLGVAGADFVYLGRDAQNDQFYSNSKALGDPANQFTLEDVIELDIRLRGGLTSISFTGTGENRSVDRIRNGSVEICWDVLRSLDGTTNSLQSDGYDVGGEPILSQTVISGTDGSFALHVGAPIAAFNQQSNLDSLGRPIILVCELPTGERFPLSSLLTSVNGGAVLFSAANRTQNTDGTAVDATVFNFDLDDAGAVSAFPGWNLVGFNRNSGYATTSSNRPVLPAGLSSGSVQIGTTLPFAEALDQFVYFVDSDGDGAWTSSEDPEFADIIVDADCFDQFAFTLTSFGVQAGSGITNLVGGYGLGLFISGSSTYGVFQFGPMRTGADFFTAGFPFPNTSTTLGWGLFTAPSAFASPAAIEAANPEFDFMIQFLNDGSSITVGTADLDNLGGANNANDVGAIGAGEASFYHIQR